MKALRWLHRWFGIALGVFISIAGVSGSWLIYDRLLAAPTYELVPGNMLPLQQLYASALPHLSAETDVAVRFPQKPELPYQFWAGEYQVVIDQYSGNVLSVREADFWPYGWMFHLHNELLLGKPGELVTGWMAVGLVMLLVMGIVLWWPRNWKHAFSLRFRQGRLILYRDLHQQLGIVSAVFLLVAAVTGGSLSFSEWTSSLINRVFHNDTAKPVKTSGGSSGKVLTLDAIVNRANEALSGGRVGILMMPAASEKPVVVRKQMGGEPHPNGLNFIYIDRHDGRVFGVIPLERAEPARRWFNWAYPLHTGQALGAWHSWILMFAGLLPAVFFITGIYMYLLRRRMIRQRIR